MSENFFHCCHVYIDVFTNCLIDNNTGQEVKTFVELVEDWNVLNEYNKGTGWYVNWDTWEEGTEVYALYAEGDSRIQGLIAVANSIERQSAYIRWAVTAPHNDPHVVGHANKQYEGVGGHLFAIAAKRSVDWNWRGGITGNAVNETVRQHYVDSFDAAALRDPYNVNPYYFVVPNNIGTSLIDTYTLDFR